MGKNYLVHFEFHSTYSVRVEAESKAEAEKKVRKQIHFNLGELENEDSLCGEESIGATAIIQD